MRRGMVWILGGALALAGCGQKEATSSNGVREVEYPPISQADAKVQATKLVEQIEAMPASMRAQFLFQHPQEVHTLEVAGDKDLQDRFKAAVAAGAKR